MPFRESWNVPNYLDRKIPHGNYTRALFVFLQQSYGIANPIVFSGIPAISIMISTVVIKGLCWIWCRLIKNSSVQALYVVSSFPDASKI